MSSKFDYTSTWFEDFHCPNNWPIYFQHLASKKDILEIGSFEGRSACWVILNELDERGTITCIDRWSAGGDLPDVDFESVEERFDSNTRLALSMKTGRFLRKMKGDSVEQLAQLLCDGYECDFAHVDGDHTSAGVLSDMILAWRLVKPGGLMVIDDYLWSFNVSEQVPLYNAPHHRPKMGIDAFMTMFDGSYSIIDIGVQVVLKKL